ALSKEIPLLLIPIAFMMFPAFSTGQRKMIVKWYSWGIFAYCVFYLIKAVVRFAGSGEESVFFYHELVTKDVNAIHVSVYVAVAFMWFFTKSKKSIADIVAATLLFAMVFLLSSKNIIIAFIALVVIHQLFFTKISKRLRLKNLIIFLALLVSLTFIGKIKDRFKAEYETMMTDSSVNDVIFKPEDKVYNDSIKQAGTNETLKPNDYFPGTAFRGCPQRMCTALRAEDNIFCNGNGR